MADINDVSAPELRKLVHTAEMLRSVSLEPEPELARSARIRFQEFAFARRASDRAAQARRQHSRRLGHALSVLTTAPLWRSMSIGLAVIAVIMSASFARASSVALPGDATYGVKRAVETLGTNLPLSHDARARMALADARRRSDDLDRALVAHRSAIVGQAVLADLLSALDSATFEAVEANEIGASDTDMAVLSELRLQQQHLDLNRESLRQAGFSTTDDAGRRLAQDEQALAARLAQFQVRTTDVAGPLPALPLAPAFTSLASTSPTSGAALLFPTATDRPATASPTFIPTVRVEVTPTPTRDLSPSPPVAVPRATQPASKRYSATAVRSIEPALSPTPSTRHAVTATATMSRVAPLSMGSGAKPAWAVPSPVESKGGQASTDRVASKVEPGSTAASDRTLPTPSSTPTPKS